MIRRYLISLICLSALAVSACATSSFDAALRGIGMTKEAYCLLSPESRAEIRRRLGISTQYVPCRGDPSEPAPQTGEPELTSRPHPDLPPT